MGKQTVCLMALLAVTAACGNGQRRTASASDGVSSSAEVEVQEIIETNEIQPDIAPGEDSITFEEAARTLDELDRHPVVAEAPPQVVGKTVVLTEGVEIDKTVHDFGDILLTDGPQQCTFTLRNTASEPLLIYQVVTSCGCTEAVWTREAIPPQGTGTIAVTYRNEDGPLPFDKTLTLYLSATERPLLLHVRGSVHEKKKSLQELYGAHSRGALGLKEDLIKVGNLSQDESRSGETLVANLGRTPLQVAFRDEDPALTLSLEPNPIPAGETAVLTYTVRADRARWGKQSYRATPVLNGKAAAPITFQAVTKENFSDWTAEQKAAAAQPVFDASTVEFGRQPVGTELVVTYTVTNRGKSPFLCHAVYGDCEVYSEPLEAVAPGEKGNFTFRIPTAGMPRGETTLMLTLITNAPLRPVITLFAAGVLE